MTKVRIFIAMMTGMLLGTAFAATPPAGGGFDVAAIASDSISTINTVGAAAVGVVAAVIAISVGVRMAKRFLGG